MSAITVYSSDTLLHLPERLIMDAWRFSSESVRPDMVCQSLQIAVADSQVDTSGKHSSDVVSASAWQYMAWHDGPDDSDQSFM